MVQYQLKGTNLYVRAETPGRAAWRLALLMNEEERKGNSVEAVHIYQTGEVDLPWVGLALIQEA